MGVMDDLMAEEAERLFDADLLPGVETISYTPQGGDARDIAAHVSRQGLTGMDGVPVRIVRVAVENHATRGIDAATMVVGGDTIEVAPRPGGTARAYHLPPLDAESDEHVLRFTLEGAGS